MNIKHSELRGEVNMYVNKTLMGCIVACCLLAHSATVRGASFSKAELSDEQFLLLDVKNKDLLFLEAVDAYGLEGESGASGENGQQRQVLLPLAALLQALEMDFVVSTKNATIKLSRGNVVFDIDLLNQTQNGPLRDNTQAFFWSTKTFPLAIFHRPLCIPQSFGFQKRYLLWPHADLLKIMGFKGAS